MVFWRYAVVTATCPQSLTLSTSFYLAKMGLDSFLDITYKLVSSENFGAYLQGIGVADQIRELIVAQSPTIVLTKSGDGYCCKTASAIRENELNFKPGEEFEHVGLDGRSYRGIITVDGNTLTNKVLTDPQSTVVSEFSADKLVLHFEVGGVEASQIYEKI